MGNNDAFTQGKLNEVEKLLFEKHKLTRSKLQAVNEENALKENLGELSGKIRGAQIFYRYYKSTIPAALQQLSSDLQKIERRYNDALLQSYIDPSFISQQYYQASEVIDPLGQLFQAYEKSDFNAALALLQQQPGLINAHSGDGYTLLFQAAFDGEVNLVRELLKQKNPAPELEVQNSTGVLHDIFSSMWDDVDNNPEYLKEFEVIQNSLIEYCIATGQQDLVQSASNKFDTLKSA